MSLKLIYDEEKKCFDIIKGGKMTKDELIFKKERIKKQIENEQKSIEEIDKELEKEIVIIKCDICSCTNTYTKEHKHIYHINGREVQFVSKRRFCSKCNNLVYDKILDNEAGQKALEILETYNKKWRPNLHIIC